MSDPPLVLARQPIFAHDGGLFGYELLYRGASVAGTKAAGTVMTARVLCEALSNPGLDRIVGDAHMFVNFDQELLESDVPLLMTTGQGVVEVLETAEPTGALIDRLIELRRAGIGIAIDDFSAQENLVPLLRYADYVKVDVLASGARLEDIVGQLRTYNLPLIAEKVESHSDVARCRAAGFSFYQGYYFARPEPMPAKSIDVTAIDIVALVADLQRADLEPLELAEKIGRDLGLTHRILKLSNSAAFRRKRAVSSIIDAVVVLGQDSIRQWASLMLMTQLTQRKSPEVFSLALIRARVCQAMGAGQHQYDSSELYTVGLLSILDALLDRPMTMLVQELPLAVSLSAALCGDRNSPLGVVLQRAIAFERGDWTALGSMTDEEQMVLSATYADAAHFARQVLAA